MHSGSGVGGSRSNIIDDYNADVYVTYVILMSTPISDKHIIDSISQIDPNKASGPGLISPRLLKEA